MTIHSVNTSLQCLWNKYAFCCTHHSGINCWVVQQSGESRKSWKQKLQSSLLDDTLQDAIVTFYSGADLSGDSFVVRSSYKSLFRYREAAQAVGECDASEDISPWRRQTSHVGSGDMPPVIVNELPFIPKSLYVHQAQFAVQLYGYTGVNTATACGKSNKRSFMSEWMCCAPARLFFVLDSIVCSSSCVLFVV